MTQEGQPAEFPAGLASWAGNRSGGVRRMFDRDSGRPSGTVFQTGLISRLRGWASSFAKGELVPRIVLLVGGPGNGKTEAVEDTVSALATALGDEALINSLRAAFNAEDGIAPRLVRLDLRGGGTLSLVQDASAAVDGIGSPARALVQELEAAVDGGERDAYLCCVNRGILDDALIECTDRGPASIQSLLEAITAAVGLQPGAPACWPLDGYPMVGIWPMDAESLLLPPSAGVPAPADALLGAALDEARWPAEGACEAGSHCPFCESRQRLTAQAARVALLEMLRFFEVATAKRWTFRDLFSLASYLLAGHRPTIGARAATPCNWAARLAKADEDARKGAKPSRESSTALFQLVAAQYQHALFHRWDRDTAASLQRDIRDLGLLHDNTANGLQWFLQSRRAQYLPAPIAASLEAIVDVMDPAMASPEASISPVDGRTVDLRDMDVRFSRSVADGLEFLTRLDVLWPLEAELMGRLASLDKLLSQAAVRRSKPHAASRIQRIARDFACRLARRTLGTRTGTVRDRQLLLAFQSIVEDDSGDDLFDVAREVENLLNRDRDFEISLTTTFGQPLPPAQKQATLIVPSRRVRPLLSEEEGRPAGPVPFLKVGDDGSSRPLALTFDLFKAVRELERGMSEASLPATVHALLDTAKARLAGSIVHDHRALERARMMLGTSGLAVEERRKGFVVVHGGGR